MTVAEFKELPPAEQYAFEFETLQHLFTQQMRVEANTAFDYIGGLKIVQDEQRGVANRERLLGWLFALTACYEHSTAVQSKHELQCQTEATQLANTLAHNAHTIAMNLRQTVEEAVGIEAAYAGIIYGRRNSNIHITDMDGSHTPYTDEELAKVEAQAYHEEEPGDVIEQLELQLGQVVAAKEN